MSGTQSLSRIGVVANPQAGAGPDAARDVLARLFEHLRGADVVLNAGTLEAEVAAACGVGCGHARGAVGDATRLADALLDARVDTLVAVGGDGTLADVGGAIVARGAPTRLLGVGIGSSNVGPLVATSADGLDAFWGSPWVDTPIHALDVAVDGRRVGIAFHDATPASTYFGTRGGRRVDLDARAALGGRDREAVPESVCGTATWIAKNGGPRLAGGEVAGGQVVASPLNDVDECRGKAVSGFLCWGPYVGCRAVVAGASALMIRTKLDLDDLRAAEPLRLIHFGVAPGDVVEVGGLLERAAIVVDGTPRAAAGRGEVMAVRVLADAVVAIRRSREV